jgi:hypothetical protein
MLAAEVVHFSPPSATASFSNEFTVSDRDDVNNLGPETVESLMVLYRVTKEDKYRQYGRMIMNAFENHSKVCHVGAILPHKNSSVHICPGTHGRLPLATPRLRWRQ